MPTIEAISGLHLCKPGNEPAEGQIKSFTVEERISKKNGKPYLYIKAASGDNGGQSYRIIKAEPTGFPAAHGNVSFRMELEKVAATESIGSPSQHVTTTAPTPDARSARIERQSARRDAIEFHRLEVTFSGDTEVKPSLERVKEIMTTLEGWLDSEEPW